MVMVAHLVSLPVQVVSERMDVIRQAALALATKSFRRRGALFRSIIMVVYKTFLCKWIHIFKFEKKLNFNRMCLIFW